MNDIKLENVAMFGERFGVGVYVCIRVYMQILLYISLVIFINEAILISYPWSQNC